MHLPPTPAAAQGAPGAGGQRWGWRAVVWAPGSEQREGASPRGGAGLSLTPPAAAQGRGLDLVKTKTQQESAIGLGGLRGGCKLTSAPVHPPPAPPARPPGSGARGGSTPAAGGLRGAPPAGFWPLCTLKRPWPCGARGAGRVVSFSSPSPELPG